MKNKIAIIGGGISGVSQAQMLCKDFDVTLFEAKPQLGGLISCERIEGNLFHKVGGHVFNTKNREVADWFWNFFDQSTEFLKAKRNAKIFIDNKYVGYPIENYLFQMDHEFIKKCINDLLDKSKKSLDSVDNFDDFLKLSFGSTLYEKYFKPYNTKIWNTNLKEIPLEWLDGKLPMPNTKQILLQNILREEESNMVHATFFYPVEGGSQFIINKLSNGLNTVCSEPILKIEKINGKYELNGKYQFDKVVYTGDVRKLNEIYLCQDQEVINALEKVKNLKSNGTSNYLCETDNTDISWLYLPEEKFQAHRIINTGNFSSTNNAKNRKTCVVEFSGKHDPEQMKKELKMLPGNLKPIKYNYEPNSYIIHQKDTAQSIDKIKKILEPDGFYLLGRFAEWQYYNMDKCIEASMQLRDQLTQ